MHGKNGLGEIDRARSTLGCIPRTFNAFLRVLMHACICYSEGDRGRTRALHIADGRKTVPPLLKTPTVAGRYFRLKRTNFINLMEHPDRTSLSRVSELFRGTMCIFAIYSLKFV